MQTPESNASNLVDSRRDIASVAREVKDSLIACGWTEWKSLGESAIAIKQFQTAVGMKEAVAQLSTWNKESDSFTLSGTYQSEGRNVLESRSVLIPKTANSSEVGQWAVQFALDVDATVADTYAARLARPRG